MTPWMMTFLAHWVSVNGVARCGVVCDRKACGGGKTPAAVSHAAGVRCVTVVSCVTMASFSSWYLLVALSPMLLATKQIPFVWS